MTSSLLGGEPAHSVVMPCKLPISPPPATVIGGQPWEPWGNQHANRNNLILEEDRAFIPGMLVRAATTDALAEQLVQAFSAYGGLTEENNQFPRVMLLMHQWFDTSEGLAHRLVNSFWKSESSYPSCSPSCPHIHSVIPKCQVYQYRCKVCHAFRFWIRWFPIHFDSNEGLTAILQDFQNKLRDRSNPDLADLIDLSKIPSYAWTRSISVRNPLEKHTRKVSLVLDHLEPHELAEHLTFLEHQIMSRITFKDFKTYAISGTPQNNPTLERSISLFNGLTQWIQCMVLRCKMPQQRADIIRKFVIVAHRLLEMNNFNTLMAVVYGLNHSSLARLKQTKDCIGAETTKSLKELTRLLASTANFCQYRRLLSESKGFRIPYLGVHMRDLIALHTALPDTVGSAGLINFRKVAQLSAIFKELWELQNTDPPMEVNLDLVTTLKLSLGKAHTEDEIYEMSLAREPRATNSPHTSPNKANIFSCWVSDISSVGDQDPEVHLNSIIEFLFRKYDSEHNGFLTRKDFEGISSNFSFIDTFSELDMDADGVISKSEMKHYFMGANCHALKLGFRHNFQEASYFKPTFCAHCTGLLWGLIKQGFKCKDCGINTHKHCKDIVVMECAKHCNSASRSNSFSSDTDGPRIRNRLQRHLRRQNRHSQSEIEDKKLDLLEIPPALGGYSTAPSSPVPGERAKVEDEVTPPFLN